MSVNPTFNLKLLKLYCYQHEESDGDEVLLKFKKKRIWPLISKFTKVTEGVCEINVDISAIEAESTVEIELWDYDYITRNDKIGIFSMLVNERGGPFTTDLKRLNASGARYSLEWEVS